MVKLRKDHRRQGPVRVRTAPVTIARRKAAAVSLAPRATATASAANRKRAAQVTAIAMVASVPKVGPVPVRIANVRRAEHAPATAVAVRQTRLGRPRAAAGMPPRCLAWLH